jgi:hypothetical protein
MAENQPAKYKPKTISPRSGAIELSQVLSLLLLPVGWLLLETRWSAWSAVAWLTALLLFLLPFYLVWAQTNAAFRSAVQVGRVDALLPSVPPHSTQIAAYHSSANPGIYHICFNCPEGNNIEPENKTKGTKGGDLCERCQRLVAQGDCH